MKKFITMILGLMLLSNLLVLDSSADALPSKSGVHLKVDKFVILYTKPSGPFVDKNHRLLIPLRAYEDLFGGKVTYQTSTKTASLEWLDQKFQFTVGSEEAKVNNEELLMDTVPVLKEGAMFLPIRLFLDQTDMKYHWDKKLELLVIDDERVIVGEPFKSFEGNDLYSDNPDGRFRINNFTISQKKNKTFQLTINAITEHSAYDLRFGIVGIYDKIIKNCSFPALVRKWDLGLLSNHVIMKLT
ncbi:copper amine oxidase N-terminal domain-containing protein [Paenibacillus sanfengchensis]|uniref:copper amine oxidase N-terminal domain-containing protein n=1 Tax=Paenibacillus sanfengchensis TaxID=3119819 RepID=UPI002FE28657